ncbi:MAG: hypothetical protein ABWZ02_10075 [Nakamurella sp.]
MTAAQSRSSDRDQLDATDSSGSGSSPKTNLRPRLLQKSLAYAPAVSAVLVTVWVFRGVIFKGRLIGSNWDARWTVAVHEHWYQVWRGNESIRDFNYFYPVSKTLGTSDAFLVQGQIYSMARLLGLGYIDSWLVTQIAFFLLGAIGVALLSKRLLNNPMSQVAFVVLTCASYPVLVQLKHVQLIGFLSVSWIALGIHDVVSRRNVRRGVAIILVGPPVLALSSWYALLLPGLVLAFLLLALLLVHRWSSVSKAARTIISDIATSIWSPLGAILVVVFVVGWAAVLWVYLPSRNLLPASAWDEVVIFSPRWSDIINASDRGGGIWSRFYNQIFDPTKFHFEQAQGFTPILLVALLAFGLYQLRTALLNNQPPPTELGRAGRPGLIATWITIIATVTFFIVDERGLGLYRLFWPNVPGFEAIRTPYRVQTILYALAFYLIIRSLELLWFRARQRASGWPRRVLLLGAVGLVAVIGLEMQRPIEAEWARSDLLPPALLAQVDQAQRSCDAVMLIDEEPNDPPWINPIDAVIFSMISGIPTPQGFSRGDPIGNPGMVGDGSSLAAWLGEQGFDGRLCRVSSGAVELVPTT